MPQIIEVPGYGDVEFPDHMSDADITAAIQKNILHKTSETSPQENGNKGLMSQSFELAKKASPLLSNPDLYKAIHFAAQMGGFDKAIDMGSFLLPASRAAKLLPKGASWLSKAAANYGGAIGQNALIGGGVSALEGDSPVKGAATAGATTAALHPLLTGVASGNPLTRAVSAGLLGSGAAYGAHQLGFGSTPTDVGAGAISAGLALRGKNAREAAVLRHLKGIEEPDVRNRLNASERLGLDYLTPAEATGVPFVGAAQGSVGKTREGSELLYNKGQSRLESEQRAINRLIKEIGTREELKPQSRKLYKSSYSSSVSQEFLEDFKDSSIVRKAMKKVNSEAAYSDQLKHLYDKQYITNADGTPVLKSKDPSKANIEHEFEYLDQVKRALDDMEQAAKRAGKNNKARLIKDQRTKLVDHMSDINTDYKEARALAERYMTTDKIRKELRKTPEEDISGRKFYNAFLKNQEKFDDLMFKARHTPKAQNTLMDMQLAFKDLISNPTARTAAGLESTSMSKPRSTGQYWNEFLSKMLGSAYDREAINLITDPKWAQEISKIESMNSNNALTQKIASLVSRGAGLGVNKLRSSDKK